MWKTIMLDVLPDDPVPMPADTLVARLPDGWLPDNWRERTMIGLVTENDKPQRFIAVRMIDGPVPIPPGARFPDVPRPSD